MNIKIIGFVYCLFVLTISFGFGGLIDSVTSVIDSTQNTITDAVTDVQNTTTSIVDSATKVITEKTQQLTNTANSILNQTTTNLKQLHNTTINEVQTAINNLQATTLDLKNQIQSFSTQTINDIKQKSEQFSSTISSNVNLAIQTVKNKTEQLINTISSFSEAMCEQQCTSFFNLPCFLLFRCTGKIKKFFLLLVLPILIAIFVFYGIVTGSFTPQCICRVIRILTCISLVLCIIDAMKKKKKDDDQDDNRNEKEKPTKKVDEECPRDKQVNKGTVLDKNIIDCLQPTAGKPIFFPNILNQIRIQADEMIPQSDRKL